MAESPTIVGSRDIADWYGTAATTEFSVKRQGTDPNTMQPINRLLMRPTFTPKELSDEFWPSDGGISICYDLQVAIMTGWVVTHYHCGWGLLCNFPQVCIRDSHHLKRGRQGGRDPFQLVLKLLLNAFYGKNYEKDKSKFEDTISNY